MGGQGLRGRPERPSVTLHHLYRDENGAKAPRTALACFFGYPPGMDGKRESGPWPVPVPVLPVIVLVPVSVPVPVLVLVSVSVPELASFFGYPPGMDGNVSPGLALY